MQYKGHFTNGISREDALELYKRGTVKESFDTLFALADLDGDGRLSFSEFLIYMHALRLLNSKKDAVKLPRRFTSKSVSSSRSDNVIFTQTLSNLQPCHEYSAPFCEEYLRNRSAITVALLDKTLCLQRGIS